MSVFVTGATGFLGRYLTRGLLNDGEDVVLLVRAKDHHAAEGRARKTLGYFDDDLPELVGTRVRVCVGALDAPNLGLSAADREMVVASCDSFIHCGATVNFDEPLSYAREINLEGTRRVLDLAEECQSRGVLRRVDYIGTAYVAGGRTDTVLESELDGSFGHRNTYETSKFEAEQLVRERQSVLPIAIHRPSIIVGESSVGRTSSFTTVYWPMSVYSRGLWKTIIGRPSAPLDMVPVDFVSDAVVAIRRKQESVGGTFHLCAGPQGAKTVAEIAKVLHDYFPGTKPLRYANPDPIIKYVFPLVKAVTFGRTRRMVGNLAAYAPYTTSNARFDNRETLRMLEGTGIAAPAVEEYFARVMDFGIQTEWGRKPFKAGAGAGALGA